MPGENLSRDEARERAALLSVDGYDVSLDLRSAVGDGNGEPRTFRSVTTLRFRCNEPGASSFADLIAPSVTAVSLNGKDLDPSEVFDGTRIALEDLAAENELVVDASAPTRAPARACTASWTRRTARSTSTRSTSRPTPAGCSRASSSPTSRRRSASRCGRRGLDRVEQRRR